MSDTCHVRCKDRCDSLYTEATDAKYWQVLRTCLNRVRINLGIDDTDVYNDSLTTNNVGNEAHAFEAL